MSPPSTPPKNGAKQAEKLKNSTPSPKRNVYPKPDDLKSIASPKINVPPVQDVLRTPAIQTHSDHLRGVTTHGVNYSEKCDRNAPSEIKDSCYHGDCEIKDTKSEHVKHEAEITDSRDTDLVSTDIAIADEVNFTDITDTDYNGNDSNRNTTNVLTESDEFNSNFKSTLNQDTRTSAENRSESRSVVSTQNLVNDPKSDLLNVTVEIRTPIRTPKQSSTCKPPSLFQRLLNFHSKSNNSSSNSTSCNAHAPPQSVITSSVTSSSSPVLSLTSLKNKQEESVTSELHHHQSNKLSSSPPLTADITISSSPTYLR